MNYRKEELLKSSWFDCCKNGVNKQLEEITDYMSRQKLEQKKKENMSLIKLFLEEVERLTKQYCNKDLLFLLTCPEGVLISKYYFNRGNKAEINFEEGAYFTEESCGTNAISLAMEMKDMITLKGNEHYCSCFYDWNCIAAPITIEGKIIGYLDISILDKEITEKDKIIFELLMNKLISKITVKVLFSNTEKIILDEITAEVLNLSAKGYKIKEISGKLHISSASVRYHRGKICEFFEARNISHAIIKAIKCRCLDLLEIM